MIAPQALNTKVSSATPAASRSSVSIAFSGVGPSRRLAEIGARERAAGHRGSRGLVDFRRRSIQGSEPRVVLVL